MNTILKKICVGPLIWIGVFYGTIANSAERDRYCQIASYAFMGVMENLANADPRYGVGEMICRAGGGSMCTSASAGEGICRAAVGSMCTSATLGEGICRAFGGSMCTLASFGEGVCKAAGLTGCVVLGFEEAFCKAA